MQPLSQQINGILYRQKERVGLLLDEAAPAITLRYAFVTQGTGQLIFPALALDDWGREHNTLALYRWVFEKGVRFPRAEVFGFTFAGRETQIFLRALETFFKFPCYAYSDGALAVRAGVRVDVVFSTGVEQASGEVPATVGWPLRHAAVTWKATSPAALAGAGWEPLPEAR